MGFVDNHHSKAVPQATPVLLQETTMRKICQSRSHHLSRLATHGVTDLSIWTPVLCLHLCPQLFLHVICSRSGLQAPRQATCYTFLGELLCEMPRYCRGLSTAGFACHKHHLMPHNLLHDRIQWNLFMHMLRSSTTSRTHATMLFVSRTRALACIPSHIMLLVPTPAGALGPPGLVALLLLIIASRIMVLMPT